MKNKIVSVDIEGNGASPPEIVEIAVIPIELGIIGSARSWLLKPEQPIHWRVKKIHGISNDMVTECPMFSDVKEDILSCLGQGYLMSHNHHVEKNILERYIPEWSPSGFIDTLALSRQKIPNRKSYKLSDLADDLGLAEKASKQFGDHPHRADYDAYVTALLFLHLENIQEPEADQMSLF